MLRVILFSILFTINLSVVAAAQDYVIGKITISDAWTRVPPTASKVGGGFMKITNTGTEPDTLVGGTVTVSSRFEVHEMAMTDGVMKMRELKPGLVIKPGETILLKPGSYHVMFMDIKEAPIAGKPIKGTLIFEKSGTVEIEYRVEPFGAAGASGQNNSGHNNAPKH